MHISEEPAIFGLRLSSNDNFPNCPSSISRLLLIGWQLNAVIDILQPLIASSPGQQSRTDGAYIGSRSNITFHRIDIDYGVQPKSPLMCGFRLRKTKISIQPESIVIERLRKGMACRYRSPVSDQALLWIVFYEFYFVLISHSIHIQPDIELTPWERRIRISEQ